MSSCSHAHSPCCFAQPPAPQASTHCPHMRHHGSGILEGFWKTLMHLLWAQVNITSTASRHIYRRMTAPLCLLIQGDDCTQPSQWEMLCTQVRC